MRHGSKDGLPKMRISSGFTPLAAAMCRSMFWVLILTGLVAGGLILLCGVVISDSKTEADRQADQATSNIAETVAHNTARTLEMLDLSLQGVIQALAESAKPHLTGRARQ